MSGTCIRDINMTGKYQINNPSTVAQTINKDF